MALIAAVLFQIFYDRYLARLVLACVVSLPVLSLLLALPGAVCLRLELTGGGAQCSRGDSEQWHLRVKKPALLSMTRLTLRLQCCNDLTGWTEKRRAVCFGLPSEEVQFPVQTEHCGRLTCRVSRARLLDCLGLFALPVRLPEQAAVLVLPPRTDVQEPPGLELASTPARPGEKDRAPSSDYELRDYRPGDPLRAIHWKQSSKRDELVVREWQQTSRPRIILAVDLFGEPERLDRVLQRLYALSVHLLERDHPHLVQWEEGGEMRSFPVSDRESLLTCMGEMFSRRVPVHGTAMKGQLAEEKDTLYFYLDAGEEAAL